MLSARWLVMGHHKCKKTAVHTSFNGDIQWVTHRKHQNSWKLMLLINALTLWDVISHVMIVAALNTANSWIRAVSSALNAKWKVGHHGTVAVFIAHDVCRRNCFLPLCFLQFLSLNVIFCKHVRLSCVINAYLLTYLLTYLPFWLWSRRLPTDSPSKIYQCLGPIGRGRNMIQAFHPSLP